MRLEPVGGHRQHVGEDDSHNAKLEARRRHRAEGAVRVDEAPRPEARVHLLTSRQHVPHDGDRALRHHVRERRVRERAAALCARMRAIEARPGPSVPNRQGGAAAA